VGTVVGVQARDALVQELERTWTPSSWRVERVALLYKPKGRPHDLLGEFSLG
jgi:hypothetical protein